MHSTARRRWTKCRTCAQVLCVVCRVLRLLCDSGMRHVGSLRVRALRRFIKATLAQSGHVVSKVRVATRVVSCAQQRHELPQVSIAVELAGVLPGDLTVAAVRDVVLSCIHSHRGT